MANLNINYSSLSSLIVELQKNNEDICNIIKNIDDAIKTLDESKWHSKEKQQLDENLIPYMKKLESQIPTYLNECIEVLVKAKDLYEELTSKDKNKIEEVDNYITMDII